jgi:hypothetical protein
MVNSILWGNKARSYTQIYPETGTTLGILYSDVEGGITGENNINQDPLFADTISFSLTDDSPCISAGIDSVNFVGAWYYCPQRCYHNTPRPSPPGTTPDLGASEHLNGWVNSIENEELVKPLTFHLSQNYPNPFNPVTMISYQLPAISDVELNIFNLLGQKVVTLVSEKQNQGNHQVSWDASGFASGVYYYRIEAGEFVDIKKMVLIK